MYRRWYVWGIGSFVRIICMLIAGPVIGQSARYCSHGECEKRLLINVQRQSQSRECASEDEGINKIREENSRLCLVGGVRTLCGELEDYATRGRSELITRRDTIKDLIWSFKMNVWLMKNPLFFNCVHACVKIEYVKCLIERWSLSAVDRLPKLNLDVSFDESVQLRGSFATSSNLTAEEQGIN